MAYIGNNLSIVAQQIEGSQDIYYYNAGTDTLAAALATGYFSDGTKRGMELNDVVYVIANGINTQCQVTAISGTAVTINTNAALSTTAGVNFKNIIDGGDATTNPWQRGTSFSNIGTTATYTADRWFVTAANSASSAQVTKTALTTVPGFSQAFNFGRGQSSVNASSITFGQIVESLDSIRLQGSAVTLSFYAASNTGFSGANLAVALCYGTGTDQSATSAVAGSWTGFGNAISTTQAITSTMTRYTFFGTVPTSATQVGLLLGYTPLTAVATVGDNVNLLGVQLELGTGATAFEHRDVQVELSFCQRYFFQINEGLSGSIVGSGQVGASSAETIMIPLPVQMRAVPTVAVTAGSFAFALAGTNTAVSGFAAGLNQTPNFISVVGTTTGVSGQATLLVSRQPNSGTITASADL